MSICCSPSIGYVRHPLGKIPDLSKVDGYIHSYSSGDYITAISDKDEDTEVSMTVSSDHDKTCLNLFCTTVVNCLACIYILHTCLAVADLVSLNG